MMLPWRLLPCHSRSFALQLCVAINGLSGTGGCDEAPASTNDAGEDAIIIINSSQIQALPFVRRNTWSLEARTLSRYVLGGAHGNGKGGSLTASGRGARLPKNIIHRPVSSSLFLVIQRFEAK